MNTYSENVVEYVILLAGMKRVTLAVSTTALSLRRLSLSALYRPAVRSDYLPVSAGAVGPWYTTAPT